MIMRIRELRQGADMTQLQLAAAMGVVQSVVSQWETETALPRARELPRLAKTLGCDVNDLFVGEPTPVEDSA